MLKYRQFEQKLRKVYQQKILTKYIQAEEKFSQMESLRLMKGY